MDQNDTILIFREPMEGMETLAGRTDQTRKIEALEASLAEKDNIIADLRKQLDDQLASRRQALVQDESALGMDVEDCNAPSKRKTPGEGLNRNEDLSIGTTDNAGRLTQCLNAV